MKKCTLTDSLSISLPAGVANAVPSPVDVAADVPSPVDVATDVPGCLRCTFNSHTLTCVAVAFLRSLPLFTCHTLSSSPLAPTSVYKRSNQGTYIVTVLTH
jgi:hypothetical protein